MGWRYPGVPYDVEIDGLTIKCLPLTRGKRKEIFQELSGFAAQDDKSAAVDCLYEQAREIVNSINGVDDVPAFLDCQPVTQIIRLLIEAAQGGGLDKAEEKNSASSSV